MPTRLLLCLLLASCLAAPARAAEGARRVRERAAASLEILGALHYLRGLCGANEGQKWRNEMQALVDAEAPSGNAAPR